MTAVSRVVHPTGSQGPVRDATSDSEVRTPWISDIANERPAPSRAVREERPAMLVRFDHGPGVARALLAGEPEGVKERGSLVRPAQLGRQERPDLRPPAELQ